MDHDVAGFIRSGLNWRGIVLLRNGFFMRLRRMFGLGMFLGRCLMC